MILSAENLSFGYGKKRIIDALDLVLEPGKLTFLLGANGSGKSTFLKLLCGLLTPEHGKILLDGSNTAEMNGLFRARHLGVMLQQRTPALDFTAEEFVMLGRTAKLPRLAPPSAADHQAVTRALSLLRMENFAKNPANRLSGGEFQRLCLASVLALESGVLLLDEPCSAQDPAQAALIFEILQKLAKEKTILVISHNLDLAACYADRILLLAGGKLFADGTASEVLNRENLDRLYDLPGFSAVASRTFRFQQL